MVSSIEDRTPRALPLAGLTPYKVFGGELFQKSR